MSDPSSSGQSPPYGSGSESPAGGSQAGSGSGGPPPPPPPPPPPSGGGYGSFGGFGDQPGGYDAGGAGGGYGAPPPPPPPPPYPSGYGYDQPGAYAGQGPVSDFGRPLAEWWKRLVAIIIDGFVIFIPLGILVSVLMAGAFSQTSVDPDTGELTGGEGAFAASMLLSYGLFIIVPAIYYWVMNGSSRGQTVGKMLMKVQVRDAATGGPIGMGRSFVREIVRLGLNLVTCGIGALLDGLWPLWDDKRQALHDKAANSVVVDSA